MSHTHNISKLMNQVKEEVVGDLFTIFIEHMREHIFIINTDQSEIRGKNCLENSDILGENFQMDFLISTPKNLIGDTKEDIQRVMNEELESFSKKNVQKSKYSIVKKEKL
jgi:hypothetical protein